MKLVKKSFHCIVLFKHRITIANRHRDNRRLNTSFSCGATQLLPQPFPSTSSGFATLITQAATTGSVAHGFQRPPVTKNTVAGKNFAFHRSEKTPWRSYSQETTQTGILRPEETHSKLNSFDSGGSKAPQWPGKDFAHWSGKTRWRSYCEDTGIVYRIESHNVVAVRKNTPAAKLLENEPVRKDAVGYFNRPCCAGAPTCVPRRH